MERFYKQACRQIKCLGMKEKRFFVGNVIVTSVNECISENGIIFALIKAGKLVNFKQTNMRLFFTKRELRLRKNRIVMMIACMAVLLAIYIILTWPKKVVPEAPVVIVEPAHTENVEIYGDYVGRIRAQQFVEVRARVEGFLESFYAASWWKRRTTG